MHYPYTMYGVYSQSKETFHLTYSFIQFPFLWFLKEKGMRKRQKTSLAAKSSSNGITVCNTMFYV